MPRLRPFGRNASLQRFSAAWRWERRRCRDAAALPTLPGPSLAVADVGSRADGSQRLFSNSPCDPQVLCRGRSVSLRRRGSIFLSPSLPRGPALAAPYRCPRSLLMLDEAEGCRGLGLVLLKGQLALTMPNSPGNLPLDALGCCSLHGGSR